MSAFNVMIFECDSCSNITFGYLPYGEWDNLIDVCPIENMAVPELNRYHTQTWARHGDALYCPFCKKKIGYK